MFLHFVAAYPVFAQTLFVVLERLLVRAAPGVRRFPDWLVRFVYRTAFVCCTTGVAILLPVFAPVCGLVGAIAFFPTVVYAPVEMFLRINERGGADGDAIKALPRWKVLALRALVVVMAAFATVALVGAAYACWHEIAGRGVFAD